MDFLKKYGGIIAILALVIAGVAIFRGGKEAAEIPNQAVTGAISGATGFNSIDFQGLGSPTTFGVAACRVPTGTRQTATSTCSVRNTTGQDLFAWVNLGMASTTEIAANWTDGSGVRVNGVASTTFLVDVATSTDSAFIAGGGDYTNPTGSILDNWRIATGTRLSISSLTATTTAGYGSPFIWKPLEYIVVQMQEETVATARCNTTAVNTTGCEPATSTRKGFHLDAFVYYNTWDTNR